MNICVINTPAGEFVGEIAEVVNAMGVVTSGIYMGKDAEWISLTKCRMFVATKDGVGFYPAASATADPNGPMYFSKNNIIFYGRVSKEIEKMYIEQTSTIQIATGKVNK